MTEQPLDPRRPRLPQGQILTKKWPVLHYGLIPRVDPATWTFRIWGAVEHPLLLTWADLLAEPTVESVCDIHCVTRWSRFDNRFSGAAVSPLIARASPRTQFVMVHGEPDYTTNLRLDDLDRPANLLAVAHNGEPLTPEHGGPVRLLVPHLYLWKSAKWLTGFEFLDEEQAGFWEENGYHLRGDPWAEERYGGDDYLRMRRGGRR